MYQEKISKTTATPKNTLSVKANFYLDFTSLAVLRRFWPFNDGNQLPRYRFFPAMIYMYFINEALLPDYFVRSSAVGQLTSTCSIFACLTIASITDNVLLEGQLPRRPVVHVLQRDTEQRQSIHCREPNKMLYTCKLLIIVYDLVGKLEEYIFALLKLIFFCLAKPNLISKFVIF